jgi:hypothetical protein
MKKQFLELSPIFIIFEILREMWNIPFMFEKEHKNDRKKLRTQEKLF